LCFRAIAAFLRTAWGKKLGRFTQRGWILDFGFWILDFGFWILDFGFWILDFGFWILDFGLVEINLKDKLYGWLGSATDSRRHFPTIIAIRPNPKSQIANPKSPNHPVNL
jgi:hypothetical protein